jgi:hypothetical protein
MLDTEVVEDTEGGKEGVDGPDPLLLTLLLGVAEKEPLEVLDTTPDAEELGEAEGEPVLKEEREDEREPEGEGEVREEADTESVPE